MNKKIVIALVAVAVLGAAVAGGAVWFLSKGSDKPEAAAEGKKKEEKKDSKPAKYLTVDKVIIMLKHQPNDTASHYMSADLVVTTDEKHEKEAKEHLPLLRSIAVKTLSNLSMAEANQMTIDQYAAQLNKAFDAEYEHDGREKPFTEVLIGKLIVE